MSVFRTIGPLLNVYFICKIYEFMVLILDDLEVGERCLSLLRVGHLQKYGFRCLFLNPAGT